MTLHELNILPVKELKATLFKCCGSASWVNKMVAYFPMDDLVELLEDAEELWYSCSPEDWKAAFAQHPKIGDIESLSKKFAATAQWAEAEQAAVGAASQTLLRELAEANLEYEKKFGYIFIVCATGKSAEEMLALLRQRLANSPAEEIDIAMDEQNKITLLRLQKLIE